MSKLTQPKNLQKMIVRSAILMLVVASLIYGYRWYSTWSQDIDLPAKNETAGFIAATRLLEDGSQTVIFKPDGSLLESPGYKAPALDKDPVWRPDGNRLFFISDREDHAQNIFRWNIASETASRRTYNSRSKSQLSFAPGDNSDANRSALVISGGFVLEFDPVAATTRQVLPPVEKERAATSEESGSGGQFDAVYQRMGLSFKEAKWTPDKRFIVAIMRRDVGEALIIQELKPDAGPIPIAVGDKIEFDINPKTGQILFLVLGFRLLDEQNVPPEYLKNGRLKLPFRHMIGIADPVKMSIPDQSSSATMVLIQSTSDEAVFHRPKISPDGSMFLIVSGRLDETKGTVQPNALLVLPFTEKAAEAVTPIVREKLYEPSWSPDGDTIVFIKYGASGKRAVHKINRDGTGLVDVSKETGDYANPQMSPQRSPDP